MANLWPERPESVTNGDRKTERGRLLNPELEQNLDKLAEAYFTGPPDQREQAVQGLLQELEAALTPEQVAAAKAAKQAAPQPTVQSGVLCPSCHRESRAGQRFCGFCGVPLYGDAPTDYPSFGGGVLGLSQPPAPDDDMDFLRERAFGGVYAEEETGHAHWGRWIAAAVLLLLAGLGYREWNTLGRPQSLSELMAVARPAAPAQPASVPAATTAAPATPAPQPQPDSEQNSPSLANSENGEQVPSQPAPEAAPPPSASQPPSAEPAGKTEQAMAASPAPSVPKEHEAEVKTPSTSAVTLASSEQKSAPPPDNGAQELQLAQRYLDQRAPTAAAPWLWKAVSKQNGHAAMLLAGLYARGEGVSQSCDQARVLLMAAAKRGVAGAGMQLQNLESGSCR